MENARYNVAVSAYQGRTTTGSLGDPESNYNLNTAEDKALQLTKKEEYHPTIAGISPLLLIPAAYLLIHGMPEKPGSISRPRSLHTELEQIRDLYKKGSEAVTRGEWSLLRE